MACFGMFRMNGLDKFGVQNRNIAPRLCSLYTLVGITKEKHFFSDKVVGGQCKKLANSN